MPNATYKAYDQSVKRLIARSGNPYLFPALKIPRTTAQHWIRKRRNESVRLEKVERVEDDLLFRLEAEKKRLAEMIAKFHLLEALTKVTGAKLKSARLPDAASKTEILKTIDVARKVLPLRECVKLVGISISRYHDWKRRELGCELADKASCPRLKPHAITSEETQKIRELFLSPKFAHFSVKSLSLYAMRKGIVYASNNTWGKLIKEGGWNRKKKQTHPKDYRTGVRAKRPNQIWHVDVTTLKLKDGNRAYLQMVIDNYSRYVLACNVSDRISSGQTRQLLRSALKKANPSEKVEIWSDGGPENDNREVRRLAHSGKLKFTLAQIDVDFSNSVIEGFFRSLKHQYLYVHELANLTNLRGLVEFYIDQHNNEMPYHSFGGATPAEFYAQTWSAEQKEDLTRNWVMARRARLAFNRSLKCGVCR